MTTRTERPGSAGARWLVSAIAIAGTLAAWVALTAHAPGEGVDAMIATGDAIDRPAPAIDVRSPAIDVRSTASGRVRGRR